MTTAAQHIHVSRQLLSELVNAGTAVSVHKAIRPTRAFGSTTEPSLGLQMAYDFRKARHGLDDIKVERAVAT